MKGTTAYGLFYTNKKEGEARLIGYSDSDMGGDLDDCKSTSRVMYFLGSNVVSWISQK